MKLPLVFFLVSTLIVSAKATSPRENEVLQTEQTRVAALIGDDYATLERVLADDLTYAHSSTFVDTKKSFMESLRSGRLKYKELESRDQVVRLYGDTAVLTGVTRVYSIAQGQDVRLNLRFIIVYTKKANRWEMVAWQSTRIP